MYSNNHFIALERLRSNSGVTPEQLRMKGKTLRRSKGWICPICSLESKRRWNIQRHFRRQHGESRLEPLVSLVSLTMETRDEKYRKHIVEEQRKLVQNISKQFGPIPHTVSSTNPFAFNYTLLDHIGNTPSSWPYFVYANLYHSGGTDILDSTEEFLNYLAYNQQEFRNLTWKPAYNLLGFSHQRAMVHLNPLRLSIMPPSSMVPLRSLNQIPLNRARMEQRFLHYDEDEEAKPLEICLPR